MMSKKVLAFGASSSKHSINKKLASYTASQMGDAEVTVLDLNDFEMPIYSIDREKDTGIPDKAIKFKEQILKADGIIISFAEHNGAYTAAFKNIFDWISRIEGSPWGDKPMFLLATSPGARGGKTVLDLATMSFKFMNSNKIHSFSLPSFNTNFTEEGGISDMTLNDAFQNSLSDFKSSL